MKLTKLSSVLAIASIFLVMVSCEDEKEKRVTEKEVPREVLMAFADAYPGATVREYAQELEAGQKFYEISCEFEGRRIDILFQPDGEVAEIEEVISFDQLPDSVNRAISEEIQQFSLEIAEKIEKGEKVFYEVKLLNSEDQKRYEMLFSVDGKLIEKEEIKEVEK